VGDDRGDGLSVDWEDSIAEENFEVMLEMLRGRLDPLTRSGDSGCRGWGSRIEKLNADGDDILVFPLGGRYLCCATMKVCAGWSWRWCVLVI
jgi:hypothetical protein